MARIVYIGAFVFFAIPSLEAPAADLERALRKLEDFQPADGRQTLTECIDIIRSEMSPGNIEIWRRLKRIINDPSVPYRVKTAVFRVAIDKADARIAADMLSPAVHWANELVVH